MYIFLQGGGFNSLSAPNQNGSSLVVAGDLDLVVVTFNYRVGVFGFIASEEVEANGDVNVGLHDQRAVFEWVQKYIHLVCLLGMLLDTMLCMLTALVWWGSWSCHHWWRVCRRGVDGSTSNSLWWS